MSRKTIIYKNKAHMAENSRMKDNKNEVKDQSSTISTGEIIVDDNLKTDQPSKKINTDDGNGSKVGVKQQLQQHKYQDIATTQVACSICFKHFINIYKLQQHMVSHENDATLHELKCTTCNKNFKYKHQLREHIRVHNGEKPYRCNDCGKRFSYSTSYSNHVTSKKCMNLNPKPEPAKINQPAYIQEQLRNYATQQLNLQSTSAQTLHYNAPRILPSSAKPQINVFRTFQRTETEDPTAKTQNTITPETRTYINFWNINNKAENIFADPNQKTVAKPTSSSTHTWDESSRSIDQCTLQGVRHAPMPNRPSTSTQYFIAQPMAQRMRFGSPAIYQQISPRFSTTSLAVRTMIRPSVPPPSNHTSIYRPMFLPTSMPPHMVANFNYQETPPQAHVRTSSYCTDEEPLNLSRGNPGTMPSTSGLSRHSPAFPNRKFN